MEKKRLDRRLEQMVAEGTRFFAGVEVGGPADGDLSVEKLRADHDAVVLAVGATAWRDLPITGRELAGIHQAMEYLPPSNKVQQGDYERSFIDVAGQHVVVIGGGDTGADCVGTAHRQGAASVTQLEIMPIPPSERPNANPWPTYPMIFRVSSAHEEGGERLFSVNTDEFLGDEHGHLRALRLVDVERVDGRFVPVEGSEREIPADLVFLAMGFLGPQKEGLLDSLGVEYDDRGNVRRDDDYQSSVPGVFVAGDAGRGQSLIVWAIAEGRSAAAGVDAHAHRPRRPATPDQPDRPPVGLAPQVQRPQATTRAGAGRVPERTGGSLLLGARTPRSRRAGTAPEAMRAITSASLSRPQCPMPSTTTVSAPSGAALWTSTTTSAREATASQGMPAGTAGEPARRSRTAPTGKRRAQRVPRSGAATVTTRVTTPSRRPPARLAATITPPRLWPTRVTDRAPLRRARSVTSSASCAPSVATLAVHV